MLVRVKPDLVMLGFEFWVKWSSKEIRLTTQATNMGAIIAVTTVQNVNSSHRQCP
jgi:hypothetical protein